MYDGFSYIEIYDYPLTSFSITKWFYHNHTVQNNRFPDVNYNMVALKLLNGMSGQCFPDNCKVWYTCTCNTCFIVTTEHESVL